jgi:uncharacterized protein (UPF0332 family)
MKPREFVTFASKLFVLQPDSAACCRSAISRAYYGVYHSAREFLDGLGVRTRSGISEHLYLQRLLKESQVGEAIELGQLLDNLHQSRKEADYELTNDRPERRGQVQACVLRATEILSRLESHFGKCGLNPANPRRDCRI